MKTKLFSSVRWLVVDDNKDLLAMMRDLIMESYGVDVEGFDSPATALAAFAREPEAFELVITDFQMPGMNGAELCAAIKKIAPTQKIFLATGGAFYTNNSARHAGFFGQLHKPFPLTALSALLAKAGIGKTEMAFA